jgi:hypothetical protein
MDVPSGRVAAAGGQADDVLPALECIRRTGHRLDRPGQVISAPLEGHPGAIGSAENGVDPPVQAGGQLREGVIHLCPAERPTGAEVEGVSWMSRTRAGRSLSGGDVEPPIGRQRQRPVVDPSRSGDEVGVHKGSVGRVLDAGVDGVDLPGEAGGVES